MKKREIPELLANEKDSKVIKKHKKLKNWARIKIIKRESDRTKLN